MKRKPTEFESKVYEALKEVPSGQVVTYASLGRRVGCRSAQAIGQALKRNPYAPEVPCHRVIASDLRVGGFKGKSQGVEVADKKKKLKREGIRFDNSGRVSPEQLYEFRAVG